MVRLKISQTPASIYWWFFQVAIVLSLAAVVVWLSLIPKSPSFILAGLYFPAFDSNNSSLHHHEDIGNTSIILDLEIFNPNNAMGIYYGKIYLTLFSGGVISSANSTPAFYQGHKKTTSRKVLIAANQRFWKGISRANVSFRIGLGTAVQYRIFIWKTRHHSMDYEADLSNVIVDSNGTFSGEKSLKLHRTLKVVKRKK